MSQSINSAFSGEGFKLQRDIEQKMQLKRLFEKRETP